MIHPASTSLANKKVLVLGLGQTGAASARWLARSGAVVRLLDTRELPPGAVELCQQLGHSIDLKHFGEHEPDGRLFDGLDLVIVSPGLVPGIDPVAGWLERSRTAGASVIGEIELFALAIKELKEQSGYSPRILGVTGTNGKTTVTALTRLMCDVAGMKAKAAGNISPAALDALMEAIDNAALPDVWVLELSSFQLMTTYSLDLEAAVVLNVTQDHLDWHGDMQSYCQAKARILEMAKIKVVNRDDPLVLMMVEGLDRQDVRSFGASVPEFVNDLGLEFQQDIAWLASCESLEFDDQPIKTRRRKNEANQPRQPGRLVRLMPADALPLVGRHNVMNVLAAAALVRSFGTGWTSILKAATEYQGEPHRMRFVRTIREVDFFDDSKGTNVGATVAGIEGLGRPLVLIAGGLGKGQDFEPLGKTMAAAGAKAVLIGADADKIKSALDKYGVPSCMAQDMQEAVTRAFEWAMPGQAVVLSPACASFDMFKSYGHRGDVFTSEVHELALSLGDVA